MKKFLIRSIIVWFVLLAALFAASKFYLDPYLKGWIDKNGPQLVGGELVVKDLRVSFFPPGLVVEGLEMKKDPGLTVSIPRAELSLAGISPYVLKTSLFQPRITWLGDTKKESPSSPEDSAPQLQADRFQVLDQLQALPYALGFSVSVQGGQFIGQTTQSDFRIEGLGLELKTQDIRTLEFALQTGFGFEAKTIKIPVKLDSKFQIVDRDLKVQPSKISLSGLAIELEGVTNIETLKNEYGLQAELKSIKDLSVPLEFGCGKLLAGGIGLALRVQTQPALAKPSAQGKLSLDRIQGSWDCTFEKLKLSGQTYTQLRVDFDYGSKGASFRDLDFFLDAKAAELRFEDLFLKPKNEILEIKVKGLSQDSRFEVKEAIAKLGPYSATARGVLGTPPNTDFAFDIDLPRSYLRGLEKFVPILASQPVEGELELKARLSGSSEKPERTNISISPLRAKGIRASVQWKSADGTQSVVGPVSANIEGTLRTIGAALQEAKLNAFVNLSNLEVQTPQLKKAKDQVLELNVSAVQKGSRLEFRQSSLKTPGGPILFQGTLEAPAAPVLNLEFSTRDLLVTPLLRLSPLAKGLDVSGKVSARLFLSGRWDPAGGIEKSPLRLVGTGGANFSRVVWNPPAPKKTAKGAAGGTSAEPPPEPILSSWPIWKNSDLKFSAKIASVVYQGLEIQGVDTNHLIKSGVLATSGKVARLFSGVLVIESSQYSLLEKAPTLSIKGQSQGLQLGPMVEWVSPEWKDLVRGAASGKWDFTISHKSRPDWMNTSFGQAHLLVKNGFLSTLQFDKLANEKLSKLPGVSQSKPLATKGASGDVAAKFELKKGIVDFEFLNILTPEKNEMKASGQVFLKDKTCQMTAELFLSDPPVRGSVLEANSDNQGRLKVPVSIKGSVFSPEFDLAGTTAKVLLENTARLEAEKAKKKIESVLQDKSKGAVDSLKKEAEKKLKDLFK